jgi:hypothetical protein
MRLPIFCVALGHLVRNVMRGRCAIEFAAVLLALGCPSVVQRRWKESTTYVSSAGYTMSNSTGFTIPTTVSSGFTSARDPGPAKKLDMLACVSPSLRPALLTGFGLFAPAASGFYVCQGLHSGQPGTPRGVSLKASGRCRRRCSWGGVPLHIFGMVVVVDG